MYKKRAQGFDGSFSQLAPKTKITAADIPDQDHPEPPVQRSYRLQDPVEASLELASGAKVSMCTFLPPTPP